MGSMTPVLSIVIPVFNTPGRLLQRCLGSIAAIERSDVEVVIVDDGSGEETKSLLKACAEQMFVPNRVLFQENRGQNGARKAGLLLCTGENVLFLDSDDSIVQGSLPEVLDILSAERPDILSIGIQKVNLEGRVIGEPGSYGEGCRELTKASYLVQSASLWGQIFRRELIYPILMSSREDVRVGEDLAVTAPAIIRAGRILDAGIDVYQYTCNQGGITFSDSPEVRLTIFKAFDQIEDALTPTEREQFRSEIEWLAIRHIVLFAGYRLVQLRTDVTLHKRVVFDYMNRHFPNWKANSYLKRSSYKCLSNNWLLIRGNWKAVAAKTAVRRFSNYNDTAQ